MAFSKRFSQPIYNKTSICDSFQLSCCTHFFFIPVQNLSWQQKFDTGSSFFLQIHIFIANMPNLLLKKKSFTPKFSQNQAKKPQSTFYKICGYILQFLFLCFQLPEITILSSCKNVTAFFVNYEIINRKKYLDSFY